MNIKHLSLTCALTCSMLALAGCASETASDVDDSETAESGLSASAARLVGSYLGDSSTFDRTKIHGLVLSDNGTFILDVDGGGNGGDINQTTNRFAGSFSATAKKLTLTAPRLVMVYSYAFTRSSTGETSLKLSQSRGNSVWSTTLKGAESYCRTELDCQNRAVPRVLGATSACEENACTVVIKKCPFTLCSPETTCVERPEAPLGVACIPSGEPFALPPCKTAICSPETKCIEKPGTRLGFACVAR
jgi:hypothetical protein